MPLGGPDEADWARALAHQEGRAKTSGVVVSAWRPGVWALSSEDSQLSAAMLHCFRLTN